MKTYDKDQKYIVDNNVEAIKLIIDHGVLEQMTPADGANSSFYSYQTDDHYCLASYHKDHEDDRDNGYMVIMVPKNSWTFNKAAQFFADCIIDNTESISYEYKKIPQKQNN
jgi:hypothetical protein